MRSAIVGLVLGALTLGWTSSARATPFPAIVYFGLTITYDTAADASLAAGDLTGMAQFWSARDASTCETS